MQNEDCLYLTCDESVLFDLNYRYKICLPDFTVTMKKGKPITIFNNLNSFSEQLRFDAELLLKVVSIGLSCQCGVTKETGEAFLKGCYESEDIIKIICAFIQKYLLCKACDKPEIKLLSNKGIIEYTCDGCGNDGCIEYGGKLYEVIEKKLKIINSI
jgi:translation initiation factor 5